MASILGIELDGGRWIQMRGDNAIVGATVREERGVFGDVYWSARIRMTETQPSDFAMEFRVFAETESEAIAALEEKIRRLPGVLAVLNAKGSVT